MSDEINSGWEITEVSRKDNRNFTEKAFMVSNGKKLTPKKVVLYDASAQEPEDYPVEFITVLTDYKSSIKRGRKDPLKNKDVIALKTEKGVYYIPLDEAQAFASCLYSLASAVLKKRSK